MLELKVKERNIKTLDEIYDALKAEKDAISEQNGEAKQRALACKDFAGNE